MVTPSVRIVDVRVLAVLVGIWTYEMAVIVVHLRVQVTSSRMAEPAATKSVTMDSPPSGVDYVRGFGDTKMALLGSSLGAVFTGLTWNIRCAEDLVVVNCRWPDHHRTVYQSDSLILVAL